MIDSDWVYLPNKAVSLNLDKAVFAKTEGLDFRVCDEFDWEPLRKLVGPKASRWIENLIWTIRRA